MQATTGKPNPCCLVTADGNVAAVAAGCSVLCLLPLHGSAVTLQGPTSGKPIACLAISSNGKALVAGERGAKPSLLLWDLSDCERPARELARAQHNFGIAALAFSPSGEREVPAMSAAESITSDTELLGSTPMVLDRCPTRPPAHPQVRPPAAAQHPLG